MLVTPHRLRSFLLSSLVVGIFLFIAFPTDTFAQAGCTEELSQAEERYNLGRFDEVIGLVNTCLEKEGVPDVELRQAYRLMGLSYLGKRLEGDARTSIRQLLELVPNYEPDPDLDPPPFIAMVEYVRSEIETESLAAAEEAQQIVQTKKKRWRKWLLIGGAVVGGGAVALALSGAGSGSSAIASPPSLPGNN